MANIKISQMTALATMNDTALMPVVDGPTNKRITGLIAKTYVCNNSILTGGPSSTGIFTINYTGSADSSLIVAGSNTRGGAGFHDFLVARNGASGATNINKFFRVNSTGGLEIVNSAYSAVILRISDSGQLTIGGTASDVNITTVGVSSLILSTNNVTNSGKIQIVPGLNNNISLIPAGSGSVVIAAVDGVLKGTMGAISPATTADIVAVFGPQPKNYFLASPSGASGLTAFRKLTADDIPGTLNNTVIAGSLVVTGTTTTVNSNDLAVANKRIDLGAVSPVSPTGTVTAGSAVVTNLSSLANIISGSAITSLSGAGTVTLPAGTVVASIDTATQITLNQPLTGTGGPVSSVTLNISGATDITANSGGLSLSGTTDKTITWDSTNTNWTSSEHWNIVTGKTFKINNVTVLSNTTVLGSATAITAGGGSTTALALGTNTGAATTVTVGGAITGNVIKIIGTANGTINLTSDVTTGIVNVYTGVTTGTVNLATGGASTVNLGGAAGAVNIGNTSGDSVLTIRGNSSTGTGTIATNAATAVVFNTNATTVNAFGAATTVGIGAGTGTTTVNNNLTVAGNLTVNGTTTTVNATTVTVDDINIELGSVVSPTDNTANGGGITLKGATDKTITWDNTDANWTSSEHWNIATGKSFKINNIAVLTNTTVLGSATTVNIGAGTGTTTVNNNLTVTGNLTVNGTTTTVNATTVTVDDINIELGSVASPTNTTANGGGITLKGATDKTITWDSPNTNWTSSEHWNIATGKSFKINNVPVLTSAAVLNDTSQTSITVAGYATTLSIGASTGTITLNNATVTTPGQLISTRASALADGTGQLYLNGATGNRIDWNTNGTGAPTFTTRSVGSKIVLYPLTNATNTDYAIGIDSGTFWSSVPQNDTALKFKWYGGITEIASIDGVGNQILTGDLAVNGGDITTNQTTFNLLNTTATTVNFAGAATTIGIGASTGTITLGNPTITGTNATTFNMNGTSPSIVTSSTGTASVFNTNALTVNAFNAATTATLVDSATTLGIGNTATAAQTVNMFTASTGSSTYNFATGATTSGSTKSINIGTAGVSGSTTNIIIGSTVSGATNNLTFGGGVADATATSTAKSVGYLGMPQQSKSSAYTTVIGDSGKHIYVTATATITIDSNANVAYPIGTSITFIAGSGATATIAITSDTMYLAGAGTTGSRTLAPFGMATVVKLASTTWFINGAGLT
jgi:hypothetical protein